VVVASGRLGIRQRSWLGAAPVPVVLVNGSAPGTPVASIESDNAGGGRLAAEHLLSLGHRRIGALTAPARYVDAAARLAGVRAALDSAGLDASAPAVAMGEPGVAGGEIAMRELLAGAPDTTAVTAYNDLMAIGAMRAVRAAGRRVPDDVSVVGFDDIGLAAFVDPALTTVAQETAEMGRWAVAQLVTAVTDGASADGPGPPFVLPVALRARASTGPPAR
jgi:LacI family transcriptional regulator